MRIALDDRAFVSARQLFILSGDVPLLWPETFVGQRNGVLGAASRGLLTMVTGISVGDVGVRVIFHEEPPPVGPEWEDVVEASFSPLEAGWDLINGQSDEGLGIDGTLGDLRVRLSSRGVDAGAVEFSVGPSDPLVEWHELAFWPAPLTADHIVKQTSRAAAGRHRSQAGHRP